MKNLALSMGILVAASAAAGACEPSHSGGAGGMGAQANAVRGTVSYAGAWAGPLDVSVFSSFPPRGRPIARQRIARPTFPQPFEVSGVPPGRYYVLAIIDRDVNDGDRYHPSLDPGGAYGGYDAPQAVTVELGSGAAEVHLDLLDPSPDSPWLRRGYR